LKRQALAATLAYLVIALVMTWPVGRNLTTRLPADLGDPAFNAWVLMWTGGQILAALSGDLSALGRYWHGNIFHPAPLTVAYSEHLTPIALQALPFYAATDNMILGYNVVFLSTFVLAGLGMFLLVREWTQQPLAAFLAGLAFAYAPYRLAQLPHLQVLSTHWMPFALYGFRRYFETRRPAALAGGSAAVVLQSLSNGYYMLFFTPFVSAYCLYEMVSRRLARDRGVWMGLAAAGLVIAIVCWPFVEPYLRLREIAPVGVRSEAEIIEFSADTHAFATASSASRLWATRLPNVDTPEGEGFPGLTILLFAAAGLVWTVRRSIANLDWRGQPLEWRAAASLAAGVLLISAAVVGVLFVDGQMIVPFSEGTHILRGVNTPLERAGLALVLLLALSAWARRRADAGAPSGAGFSALAVLAAALLALGPRIEAAGHRLGVGPYAWLLEYVPGFDGLRVPARFLMIVACFMAALAGFGAAWLLGSWRRRRLAQAVVVAGMAAILTESFMVPLAMHGVFPGGLPLGVAGRLPPIYRVIRDLPGEVVLLELPIGDAALDTAATFYAGVHRRPLVNGFSGFWPERYFRRAHLLMRAPEDPPEAMSMLEEDGVTHVLVHEAAIDDGRGPGLSAWLHNAGARIIFEDAGDKLFQVD
jgi:hypothetical protein